MDLGEVERIAAGAIGIPGKRTFWVGVWGQEGVARLALEKEQLQALGLAIDEVLGQLVEQGVKLPGEAEEPKAAEPPARPSLELTVGRIALGFEEAARRFLVVIHETDADPEGPPTCAFRVSVAEAQRFSRQAATVVAAGRPRCPLCGNPVNPEGHVCPRRNGHFELV